MVDDLHAVAAPSHPVPANMSVQQVQALAEHVARELGYAPGDDLHPIVEGMGGSIVYTDSHRGHSGSIEIKDNKFEIRISTETGILRDRFTIAHELGHLVLHYLYPNAKAEQTDANEKITWLEAARFGSGQVEYEANWFAAAFLMPEASFTEAYEKYNGDIISIARDFKVSLRAAEVRRDALQLHL